ncbi:MAG: hypothetical protein H6733_13580 [Alphaproteobacteria bacterium]|nr:hypothetical protein [Alphaproteobacteria bacterium]
MAFAKLLADPQITVQALGEHLDGLDHAGRAEAFLSLSKAQQKRVWDLAASAAPITIDHFVPASVGTEREVIHHGLNTLPAFRHFQKRFARAGDGSERLFGYNEGSTRPLIGPGYFVAHTTAGNPTWEERGAWVVDYFQVPDGGVPSTWPPIKRNDQGLQVLVYHKTRDFMRKVSAHCSIGMAFKVENSLNNWFVLVREDA